MNDGRPQPFRRLLQFRLSTLLVLVLAVCLAAGWLSVRLRHAQKQRQAIEAIGHLGGRILYDHQVDADGKLLPNVTPPGPAWLRHRMGVDFFARVVDISYGGLAFEPASGMNLGMFTPRDVTDTDLIHLAALSRTRRLDISGTRITDAGLEQLGELAFLEALDLSSTDISGTGLRHIASPDRLKALNLEGTKINNAGFEQLLRFTELEILILRATRTTDSDLPRLSAMPQLKQLDLTWTETTDKGMKHLETLRRLEELTLEYNLVTEAGVLKLRKKLPELRIELRTVESLTP